MYIKYTPVQKGCSFKRSCCSFKRIFCILRNIAVVLKVLITFKCPYWLFVFTQLSNSKKCCHLDKILKLFISHNYAPSLGPSWYSSHSSYQLAYSQTLDGLRQVALGCGEFCISTLHIVFSPSVIHSTN